MRELRYPHCSRNRYRWRISHAIRHRVEPRVALRPLQEQSCFANSPAAVHDGQPSLLALQQAVEARQLKLSADEAHYAIKALC